MIKEEKALLDTISFAEGTLGKSNNGYDILFNNYIINGWTENTDIVHQGRDWITGSNGSSAAGRYQIVIATWVDNKINLPMTISNQNKRGLELINVCLGNIDKTKLSTSKELFSIAIEKLGKHWEGVKVKKIEDLYNIYIKALSKY